MPKNKRFLFVSFFFLFAFISFFLVKEAWAATARLTWNANTESDLAGYKVYWGTTGRANNNNTYPNSQDVGNVTTYKVDGISDTGTTYFAVTAKDTSTNESGFSDEVKKLPGDMTKDDKVDMSDFNVLATNFGTYVADCDTSGNYNAADVNLDCNVDMSDFNAIATNFAP